MVSAAAAISSSVYTPGVGAPSPKVAWLGLLGNFHGLGLFLLLSGIHRPVLGMHELLRQTPHSDLCVEGFFCPQYNTGMQHRILYNRCLGHITRQAV